MQITHNGLVLNANLSLASGKTLKDGAVLITHGTLAHNGMLLIQKMQTELAARGVNSLALSLGSVGARPSISSRCLRKTRYK